MATKKQTASKTASKSAAKKAPVLSPEERRLRDAYERRNALRKLQGIPEQ